ncbi:50S ribosomal L9 C-terminal domain-containing protein [Patescibacteria group bacterium]
MAALEEQAKVKVDKKQIKMKEHIKSVGIHDVKVTLADGVVAVVKVEVKAKV